MEDLQALLSQYAAEAESAIAAIDADFAAKRSIHDEAIAKHRKNATRYATPATPPALSVQVGDRSFTCANPEIIAAARCRSPQAIALLREWLWTEHKVYVLPEQIQYEVKR